MTWCADRCQQFQIVYLQVPLAWRSTIFSFSLFSPVNGVNAKDSTSSYEMTASCTALGNASSTIILLFNAI